MHYQYYVKQLHTWRYKHSEHSTCTVSVMHRYTANDAMGWWKRCLGSHSSSFLFEELGWVYFPAINDPLQQLISEKGGGILSSVGILSMNGTWRTPCCWNAYITLWLTATIHTHTLSWSNCDSFEGNRHTGRTCGHVDTHSNWLIPLRHSVGSLVKPNLHSYKEDRE